MATIVYRQYKGEGDLPHIMGLVQSELSEPYVVYTFRYFLHEWPHLSFLAFPDSFSNDPIGAIVSSSLVRHSIEAMKMGGVDEIMLETEYDNHAALSLYESLGFIREKRLYRFYLNGKDAFRLILVVPPPQQQQDSIGGADSDDSSSTPPTTSFIHQHRDRHHHRPLWRAPPYRAIPVIPYSDDEDDDHCSSR